MWEVSEGRRKSLGKESLEGKYLEIRKYKNLKDKWTEKKRKNDKTKIEIENMQNSKGRRMNCKEIKVRRRDMKRKNGAKRMMRKERNNEYVDEKRINFK